MDVARAVVLVGGVPGLEDPGVVETEAEGVAAAATGADEAVDAGEGVLVATV